MAGVRVEAASLNSESSTTQPTAVASPDTPVKREAAVEASEVRTSVAAEGSLPKVVSANIEQASGVQPQQLRDVPEPWISTPLLVIYMTYCNDTRWI